MPEPTGQAAPAAPAPATPSPAPSGLPDLRQALDDFVAQREGPKSSTPTPAKPETPATDATEPATEKPEVAPSEAQPKADESKPAAPEAKSDLKGLTAEELLSNPDVAGKVGRLAQQQAREEVQKFFAEKNQEAWRARLAEAVEADPDHPLAQLLKQVQPIQQPQDGDPATKAQAVLVDSIAAFVRNELPEPVKAKYQEAVAGKDVTFPTLVRKVADLLVEHELPKRIADEREAIRRDLQAEMLGSEPTPHADASKPATPKKFTLDRAKDMTPQEVFSNFDEIVRSIGTAA